MNEKNKEKLEIENANGKRNLLKTYLKYSEEIAFELKKDPNLINYLTNKLGISKEEFLKILSCEVNSNISIYDEAYKLVKNNLK